MKSYIFALLIVLIISSFNLAQNKSDKFSLIGTVVDSKSNEPLAGVSVLVLSRETGSQIAGAATDNKGNFTIEKISEDNVKVRFSMVGYQSQLIDSVDISKSSRIGLIKLIGTTIDLPEIVVKSIKPVIEFYADRQVINMDRLPGNAGSVTDALKNSGLVEVEPATNKITVRGQPIKIKMDGHEYNMPAEMLAQLPAAMIDQVEVILAPGAKESAEGGTYILNLITKRETFTNSSGMFNLSSSSNKNSFGGAYLNYKVDKFNFFGQAYGSYFAMENFNESERYVYTSPNMYYQKTIGDGKNTFYSGYIKLGFDYDFDQNNSITFFTTYNGYNYNSLSNGYSIVNNQNSIFQYSYNRIGNNEGTNNSLSFYGFYKRKFASKGNELTVDAMLTLFGNPTNSDMNLKYSNRINSPQLQKSNTDVNAKTLILKADYVLPIKTNKLEAGYNLTYRTRTNDYTVQNYMYQFRSWKDSLNLSNEFRYNEIINALYAAYAHKLGDVDVKLGLRSENLNTKGNQITQKIEFAENFLSFFPNLNVSYKISDLFQLSFNAFRRVTYPQIFYINPFRQYNGPNSFFAGNPKLKPTYLNSYAINLSQYLSVFYNYTTGSFTSAMATENDTIIVSTFLNLNSEKAYGINLTLPYYNSPMMPFKLPDFINSFYVSFNYRYAKQSGQYLAEDLSLTNKTYTLNANLGLKLWYDIDASISFFYLPKIENRRTVRSEMKNLSLYLNKMFMDRKLRVYILVNDILKGQKGNNEMIGGNYYTRNYYEMRNSRSIGIGISYMFNDYKERRDRNIDDGRDAANRGF
ncbi:MAG: outer membrane beta-barrel family protein [Bacteroidota bacterium]